MPFVSRVATCHPEKKHAALGLCVNCWAREHRAGWPNGRPVGTQQKNAKCHPDKLHYCRGMCAPCYKKSEFVRKNRMDGYYKRTYGMTEDEKSKMSEAQSHACKLCLRKKKLFVDHCHATGKVRALLCNSCNMSLGMLRDKVDVLERAIAYLREHS